MNAGAAAFPLAPGISLLNHASFGVPTLRSLELAADVRRRLEADAARELEEPLHGRLRACRDAVADFLGLTEGELALTANATEAASAVAGSAALGSGGVVVLSDEYPSVARAWRLAARRSGARCIEVEMPTPLTAPGELLDRLDAAAPGRIAVLQASFVTSASAVVLPLRELSAWTHARGGALVVDAAHGAGHLPLGPVAAGADIAFGSLHKWLPVPRPAGFLWRAPHCRLELHPAIVSLRHDEPSLADRFSWPGTFDPAPRLCLPDAIEQWRAWHRDGALARAAALSAQATTRLAAAGARPTAALGQRPPRLQAVMLDGVPPARLRAALDAARVRAWVGGRRDGSLLRLSTHVFNDEADVERAVAALASAQR